MHHLAGFSQVVCCPVLCCIVLSCLFTMYIGYTYNIHVDILLYTGLYNVHVYSIYVAELLHVQLNLH